jgi:hypothetical protein
MVAFAPSSEALHKPETCARAQGSYASSDARGTLKSSTARDLATAACTEHIQLVSCARDPITYAAGSNCLYEYCHGRPRVFVDPWGTQIMVTLPPGHHPFPYPTSPLPPKPIPNPPIRHQCSRINSLQTLKGIRKCVSWSKVNIDPTGECPIFVEVPVISVQGCSITQRCTRNFWTGRREWVDVAVFNCSPCALVEL